MTLHILGQVVITEAVLLLIPFFLAVGYGESGTPLGFGVTIGVLLALGIPCVIKKPKDTQMSPRSGFVIVALSWLLLSIFGAMPFTVSGRIPNYIDALFETISGFTTTGATILKDIEILPKSLMFWRTFTHWIGGMGVLVFVIAVLPKSNPAIVHLLKAEVPGPQFGKLVSKIRFSARILYAIYIVLTLLEMVLLVCDKSMSFFDAITHTFATAGTGGFSNYNNSIAHFDSLYVEIVITVFMLIFSINFNLFYLILVGHVSEALRSEELRALFLIFIGSAAAISISLCVYNVYDTVGEAVRHASFQTASVLSTTGFSTADFSKWPVFCQTVLIALMFIGGSAGSTAGGLKISRVIIMFKSALINIKNACYPRKVMTLKLDKRTVSPELSANINSYFIIYLVIVAVSTILVSVVEYSGYNFATFFSAVVSCLNNVGPAIEGIGAAENYSAFSWFSKLILSFDMLAGRLEIMPMLLLFYPKAWSPSK